MDSGNDHYDYGHSINMLFFISVSVHVFVLTSLAWLVRWKAQVNAAEESSVMMCV